MSRRRRRCACHRSPGPAAAVELSRAAVIDNRPDRIAWKDNPGSAKD
jgi:urease accessory protein UreE